MVSAAASAQFSVNAGYVNTIASVNPNESSDLGFSMQDLFATNGISVGLGYDMNIQGGFGIAWGLNYTYGFKNKKVLEVLGNTLTLKNQSHSLDIPVRLTYTYAISDNFKVFGFAGPKFVYSFVGESKLVLKEPNVEDSDETFKWFDKEEKGGFNLSPFDVKAGLGAGINFSNVIFKVGYDWGLLNAYTGKEENLKIHSNQFYVTLGYAF
ncbi:MAG: PorT family protein [Paludibacter sp.]|nr:PorT family protein [Paludibacter sp.]